jgi:hypothetical protein
MKESFTAMVGDGSRQNAQLRKAVYEIFDPGLAILKSFLYGEGREVARDFEKGFSFLANLLGFAIVPLSVLPQLTNGPDVIVSTPNENIAVVECTIRHLDQDNKLAKLVSRTNLLTEKLRTLGHGHLKVQPVTVSLLTRAELQAELDEAGKNNVAVLTKEDLQMLITDAIVFPKAEELFARLTEYIPRQSPPTGQILYLLRLCDIAGPPGSRDAYTLNSAYAR